MTQHRATPSRLAIAGFKSFADETHLDILPGLTGIIGPNGCGKSNIVEALRWIMGETSARALRGNESDDLIFAGTGIRPARNIAKVTLHLNDTQSLAPAPFTESDELEITRQVERGSGSTYRINNRVMRARDVQTLFADLSSGARSSSIISQNHVSQLINQRPEERRTLLEEAAGITGLHVRRRDAELKLRQTESNLERAEEHRLRLEEQLKTLGKQSEQARHYRHFSENIRRGELRLLSLQHARAERAVQQHHRALKQTRQLLEETEKTLDIATHQHFDLKQQEDTHQETIDRIRPELETLRVQVKVTQNNLEHSQKTNQDVDKERRLLARDQEYYQQTIDQIQNQRQKLEHDIETVTLESAQLPPHYQPLKEKLDHLKTEHKKQSDLLAALNARHHENALQRESATSLLQARTQQLTEAQQTLQHLLSERDKLEETCQRHPSLTEAEQEARNAQEALQQTEDARETSQTQFHEKRLLVERATHAVHEAETRKEQLEKRLRETKQHYERAQAQREHTTTTIAQLEKTLLSEEERNTLSQRIADTRQALQQAVEHAQTCQRAKEHAEQAWLSLRALTEKQTQNRTFLTGESHRLAQAYAKQKERLLNAQSSTENAQKDIISLEELDAERRALATLEQQRLSAQNKRDEQKRLLQHATSTFEAARTRLNTLEAQHRQRQSECDGLRLSLGAEETQTPDPLIERLNVPQNLTKALASALADGLEASLTTDPAKPTENHYALRHWTHLPALTSPKPAPHLPPLAAHIDAPAALARALEAVFLVKDTQEGNRLQEKLHPGQSLVCLNGHLWRWDGFVRSDKAPSPEAVRLEQQQRLRLQEKELAELTEKLHDAQKEADKAQTDLSHHQENLERLTNAHHQSDEEAVQKRRFLEEREQRAALQQEQLTLAQRHLTAQQEELDALAQRHEKIDHELSSLPDDRARAEEAQQQAHQARERAHRAHEQQQQAQSRYHEAERHAEQALLQHQTVQTRLEELRETHTHLQHDLLAYTRQQEEITHALETLNLTQLTHDKEQVVEQYHHAEQHHLQATHLYQERHQHALAARQHYEQQQRSLATIQGQFESLRHQCDIQTEALLSLEKEVNDLATTLNTLPALNALEAERKNAQTNLDTTHAELDHHQKHYDDLIQKEHILRDRLEGLRQQKATLDQTWHHLQHEGERLKDRQHALHSREKADATPHIEQLLQNLQKDMERIVSLEKILESEAQKFTEVQTRRSELQQNIQQNQERLRHLRDELTRIAARLDHAEQAQTLLREENPLPEGTPLPHESSAHAETLVRREIKSNHQAREELGPVNLCAEEEFQKNKSEADRLAQEHQELVTAIARLRSAIGSINRQGRKRLKEVFDDVNTHFQALFERMFGGGKAHLSLTGSEDPLDAGLEIFAQPPGKKLSSLSLLSGGEQALTALSLIFAAFHSTPAPICVLDEVDAPLDDANIERFCQLLTEMTTKTKTRFLVVTHHQLTMAHMDRLFGVTMQERGVSRLLSVNLDESIQMTNG
ncbi:AAA family ATPase [Saccharibacter sp. 17.LH.SD]|uniref:AAA family ATPase n=1 Tax=Saccharibacter sp. 17.LH.SD TaxID=2689393 RepID=UPI00136BD030|nr:AAA family ATPase [Saccharibacter sp. 17.LH.SD]MXV44511.1 AAA family ATPase [Saccharibacter sp. 17.LH.SD]